MVDPKKVYDVIVIGSGHAGVEAALASTRVGCSTLILTQNLDTIAQMSCNPAIGGIAKGHIVREIDALGGAMGENADATGIQFRLLNRSKGSSVQSPRVQCDKKAYQFRMKATLERTELLDVKQATVSSVLVDDDAACGVETDIGVRIRAKAVVVTSGTFMRGLLHVGERSQSGGRMGDTVSNLSGSLARLGFEIRRFKTGTPCRIGRRSIDFSRCEIQLGDERPTFFSFINCRVAETGEAAPSRDVCHVEQLPCWITRTNRKTHEIIRRNIDRSPLFSGRINGIGPRYCPSIEDKVVKFPNRLHHQIFLEPEGRNTDEFYINGISTSLPADAQLEFVRSIEGLERAEIMRPGYAVEYDFFPPTQLDPTLQTRRVSGLYFAGQVNGTSGYEEAAAQGLIAGASAALKVLGRAPLCLARSDGYIAVMIDDLVSRGTDEPYRMFTSRAEDRLRLRHDNADQRLTPIGRHHGLIGGRRWTLFCEKSIQIERLTTSIQSLKINGELLSQLMKRPDFEMRALPAEIRGLASEEIWASVEADVKYAGYLRRQQQQNERFSRLQSERIPEGFDFAKVPGLRLETRQKLAAKRPTSVGQAASVSGITAADLSILAVWLSSNRAECNVPT